MLDYWQSTIDISIHKYGLSSNQHSTCLVIVQNKYNSSDGRHEMSAAFYTLQMHEITLSHFNFDLAFR